MKISIGRAINVKRRIHPVGDLVLNRRVSMDDSGVLGAPRFLAAATAAINASTVST